MATATTSTTVGGGNTNKPANRNISFDLKRVYKDNYEFESKPKGKIIDIIDFHLNGRNRYMKINQPTNKDTLLTEQRDWTRFRNPKLNKYEHKDQDSYEPKKYVFDYNPSDDDLDDDDDVAIRNRTKKLTKKKSLEKLNEKMNQSKATKKPIGQSQNQASSSQKNQAQNSRNTKKPVGVNEKSTQSDTMSQKEKVDQKKVKDALRQIENVMNKKNSEKDDDDDERTMADQMTERERSQYFKEKNIQVNMGTKELKDAETLTKKPVKRVDYTQSDLISIGTQTPRTMSDPIQQAPDSETYLRRLIKDVQDINDEIEKEKEIGTQTDDPSDYTATKNQLLLAEYNGPDSKNGSKKKTETRVQQTDNEAGKNKRKESIDGKKKDDSKSNASKLKKKNSSDNTTNSLGLTMRPEQGISMAIIRDPKSNGQQSDSEDKQREVTLLTKNYQNLEYLVTCIEDNPSMDQKDHLRLAKLNRLKVLMELSMNLVGRKYYDIKTEDRNKMELQANRFHTTYPLPGEEIPLEEIDEDGRRRVRLPIKVINEDGVAKIDINNKHIIDPNEFLTLYTNRLVIHAQDSTGLQFDNITVTIPTNYGSNQREAIKTIVNDATNRTDAKILTRPVAAAVIMNNKRLNENPDGQTGESYKIVFDLTDTSIDASVIFIKDAKDFQVVSNMGDAGFGQNDVDERIVQVVLSKKMALQGNKASARSSEGFNPHSNLIKDIKKRVTGEDRAIVDLNSMSVVNEKGSSRNKDYVVITKDDISTSCKDVYDWALVHIDHAVSQADVKDASINEIIMIGGKDKLPGFHERLTKLHPRKKITYVGDEELAVGAAIVGRKIKYQSIKVTEILARSIGIGLYTGIISYLLFRNTPLPCVGGCVYSTLVDDQETMVLDIYEGERPHVKFCRYLGEITIDGLPRGRAGRIKVEVHLRMDSEGLLDVRARNLSDGKQLEVFIDANPEQLMLNSINEDAELDPIEAERYKKADYDLVLELEQLDDYITSVLDRYKSHRHANLISQKVHDTREWMHKNKHRVKIDDCVKIRNAMRRFLKHIESEQRRNY